MRTWGSVAVGSLVPDGPADDGVASGGANNALADNITVPDTVEAAADGNVYLTGTVAYGIERAAAEAALTGLTGVRNAIDDIEISYAIDPVDVDLHVQQGLERSALVPDGSDVAAQTKDGIITLTGHVRTWAEDDAVVSAALMAQGVIDVPRRTPDHRLTGIAAVRRGATLRISAAATTARAAVRDHEDLPLEPVHLADEQGLYVLPFGQHPGDVTGLGDHPGRGEGELLCLSG